MADPVTLNEFLGILLAALGGREGLKYLIGKYSKPNNNGKANGYVTQSFCQSRHTHIEDKIAELREGQKEVSKDVKDILKHIQF